ncbi:MAG: CHAD domain-containing protein [Acidimicrobiia bacterium]|nr:CHAD domain-containing protein [Acidimicrobiia bacterium]
MRFREGETLAEGIDRVVGEQFAVTLGVIDAPPQQQAFAVHSTRKALKRLRAILRLVRDTISHDCYHTDNQVLKLVAAELSAVRDTWVMAEVLDRLLPHDPVLQPSVTILIARLEDRYRTESQALLENEAQMVAIVEQLQNARERSRKWSIRAGEVDAPLPHEFASIEPGLQRVYRRGRRGMRIVADSPTDTLLHVWRKRAKYLRHQIEALNILDPVTMLRYELELEQLTDLLGDDHDLAVLLARFNNDPALVEGIEMDPVLAAVGARRHDLQSKAIDMGRTFFASPSTDFVAFVAGLWGDRESF